MMKKKYLELKKELLEKFGKLGEDQFFIVEDDNQEKFVKEMNILLAIFFIAETFFGWESAIFLSAETKNPSKIMPKALIYGTLIIAVLSFFLAFTAMGTIPWAEFSESVAPLKDLGAAHFGVIGGIIFAVLIFISAPCGEVIIRSLLKRPLFLMSSISD